MAIKFGSEVYTWFMDGYGEGNKNKLPHMMKVIKEAGFTGIEPMVLEPYDDYWLGDCKDPAKLKDALDEAGIELAALALICKWDGEEETEAQEQEQGAEQDLHGRGLGGPRGAGGPGRASRETQSPRAVWEWAPARGRRR